MADPCHSILGNADAHTQRMGYATRWQILIIIDGEKESNFRVAMNAFFLTMRNSIWFSVLPGYCDGD